MRSKEIAARATAAKFGGETPDVRALARDLLEVLGELEDAKATIRRARSVVQHWRDKAIEDLERDEATAVRTWDGLQAAADRLERALDGDDPKEDDRG